MSSIRMDKQAEAMIFDEGFGSYVCDGDSIAAEREGYALIARIVRDDDRAPPWDRHCGHGPVSAWTTRPKDPSERVLHEDRHGSRRYYGFAEAVRMARRDGWRAPGKTGERGGTGGAPKRKATDGEIAARAAEHDFAVLRAWCADEWHYVGIVLAVARDGVTLDDHAASLWGIEANWLSGDNAYLTEVANELADEALDRGRAALTRLCARAVPA